MGEALDLSIYVRHQDDGTAHLDLAIEGIDCAACIDEWTGVRKLKSDDVPLLIMLQDIESVGRYALQFKWSDGHDTGIYSYKLLRELCQCDLCQPVKPQEPKSRRLL